MCSAKNLRHFVRSFVPFEFATPDAVIPGSATPEPPTILTTHGAPRPPTSSQVVGNQGQTVVGVLQVTEALQNLNLGGSTQGTSSTIYQPAAVSSPSSSMVAPPGEGQVSDLITLLMDAHNHFQ
ncbi:hypothetical protein BGZ51_006977 [Haplosporangium sp. Z 767]|nr:hypothetical protein BGZ51_006977 [Haplosporangium sp. Z 767]KAF9192131.1 hypothetical protein BGZ50_008774 [Haplosporangium sp. Z 11]